MSGFSYQHALCAERNEIRIPTLKRGEHEQPIECSLTTVSLDDNPVFTALSYA